MNSKNLLYVITGATGNTGKPLAEALLNAGRRVRVISRDAAKAADLVAKGAELFVGNSVDESDLLKAFHGADVVYAMIPPSPAEPDLRAYQIRSAENIANALATNNVPRVMTLSSLGAHLEHGTGVVQGLNDMERIINNVPGLHVLHLRPAYFMENSLGSVLGIKQQGFLGTPIRADLKMPVIAVKDIAAYAAQRMMNPDWQGQNVQHLLGARDVSYEEITKVYGAAIGKPDLQYVQIPIEGFKDFIIQAWGASPDFAAKMGEFTEAVNSGHFSGFAVRDDESTTPTTIEEFAQTVAYVYNM